MFGATGWFGGPVMQAARAGMGLASLAIGPDNVLVTGGVDATGRNLRSVELMLNGVWTPQGDMTIERSGHTATALLDGRVLVAGGRAGLGLTVSPSAEVFEVALTVDAGPEQSLTANGFAQATANLTASIAG